MYVYQEIYNVLKTSTPTNGELTEMVYGYDDGDNNGYRHNIRKYLGYIRQKYKVSITPDQYGRYHMSIPQYTWEDSQLSFAGKIGRPRHFKNV